MGKQANAYIQRRAESNLDEQDQAAYGSDKDAAAVSNDILRAMLASKAERGEEDLYPEELPPEVFNTLYTHSMAMGAYVDQIRERTNVKGPAVQTSMLTLAAMEMDKNAVLIATTFATAEELVDETPAGWNAAKHYASADQKEKLGDVPGKTAALKQMTLAAGSFIRDSVRVPDGPELFAPGSTTSTGVEDARPVLRKHIELASSYGPNSTGKQLAAALGNPNVKGSEEYHVQRMIEAEVPHDVLVQVMGTAGLSFADFPNLAIAHFTDQASVNEGAIIQVLWKLEDGREHEAKIVDLFPLADPDKFMAQLALVKSYNALVEFQEARRIVDPPDGERASRLATEADIEALTSKPLEAQQAYALAQSLGIEEWAASEAPTLGPTELRAHMESVDDAQIQGAMTHELVFGGAPGEESGAALMDQAEKAAKKALDADAAARDKAEALGMKLPGVPATERLKAWYSFAKSVTSTKEKVQALQAEGLGGSRGYDAFQASISIAQTAAGVVNQTASAAADAYEQHAAGLKSRIATDHLHDIVSPHYGIGELGMPDQSTPEIDGLVGQADAFKALAKAADGVALVGDVIGLADGFKKMLEGDVSGGALDVTAGAVGIAGSVAARRVAAQGLASGASFNIAQAAGPVGYLVAYFQLIHSTFARMEAADNALLAKLGVGIFTGVNHQVRRGGHAAEKAAAIKRMSSENIDPTRTASFERELARETKVAAAVMGKAHGGVLGILSSEPTGDESDIYQTWLAWPALKEAFRLDYAKASAGGPKTLLEVQDSGDFTAFHAGSSAVFTSMKELAEDVEAFVKRKAE